MNTPEFYKLLFRIIRQLNRNGLISNDEKSKLKDQIIAPARSSSLLIDLGNVYTYDVESCIQKVVRRVQEYIEKLRFGVPSDNYLPRKHDFRQRNMNHFSTIQPCIWEIDEENFEEEEQLSITSRKRR